MVGPVAPRAAAPEPKVPVSLRWLRWVKDVPRSDLPAIGVLVIVAGLTIAVIWSAGLVVLLCTAIVNGCWYLLRWGATSTSHRVVTVFAVLVIGRVFYRLRSRARLLYAWIELASAGVLLWLGLDAAANSRDKAVSLGMGSVYILVRAFDNLVQGRKEAQERQRLKMAAAQPAIIELAAELAGRGSTEGLSEAGRADSSALSSSCPPFAPLAPT